MSWFSVWLLGYLGFSALAANVGQPSRTFLDNAYLSLQLFVLGSGAGLGTINPYLEWARFLAPVVAAYGVAQALALVFSEQVQLASVRWTYRDHVVVCGLGASGSLMARQFRAAGQRIVVIERDRMNHYIAECREFGAAVVLGDATDLAILVRAGAHRASSIIAVCGTDDTNVKIAVQGNQLNHNERKLVCFAHTVDPHLQQSLAGWAATSLADESYQVEFFNVPDTAARLLLQDDPLGLAAKPEGAVPHLLVIGTGTLGERIIVRAERLWRREARETGLKLHVTLVGAGAQQLVARLPGEHPLLMETCSLDPHEVDVSPPGSLQFWLAANAKLLRGATKAYVCIADDSRDLAASLNLVQRTRELRLPITICISKSGGLAETLLGPYGRLRSTRAILGRAESQPATAADGIKVFSVLEETCRPALLRQGLYEDLAIAIHELFRHHELARGRDPGDRALAAWTKVRPGRLCLDDLGPEGEHIKESNRHQALAIGARLWSEGYGIEPIDVTAGSVFRFDESSQVRRGDGQEETELDHLARLEHESWLTQKRTNGWTFGPRDDDARTSPYILPWYAEPDANESPGSLTEEDKEKNRQIVRDWPLALAAVDLQIFRRTEMAGFARAGALAGGADGAHGR